MINRSNREVFTEKNDWRLRLASSIAAAYYITLHNINWLALNILYTVHSDCECPLLNLGHIPGATTSWFNVLLNPFRSEFIDWVENVIKSFQIKLETLWLHGDRFSVNKIFKFIKYFIINQEFVKARKLTFLFSNIEFKKKV